MNCSSSFKRTPPPGWIAPLYSPQSRFVLPLKTVQSQLTECLCELDDALKDLESTTSLPPGKLGQVRNRQQHNHSKLLKLVKFLEVLTIAREEFQKCKETPYEAPPSSLQKDVAERPSLASSSAAVRQSRLCVRGESWSESLTSLLSLLRPSETSLRLSELVQSIGPQDTIEERSETFLSVTAVLNDLLDE